MQTRARRPTGPSRRRIEGLLESVGAVAPRLNCLQASEASLRAIAKPGVVDAGPQASIATFHDADGPLASMPADTAGVRNRTTIMAAIAADLVPITCKAAPEDGREAVAMHEPIEELNAMPERQGRPIARAIVLTMTVPGAAIVRQVRRELEAGGYRVPKAEIAQRVAYPEPSMRGLAPGAVDPEGAAARDVAKLVTEIARLAKSATNPRTARAAWGIPSWAGNSIPSSVAPPVPRPSLSLPPVRGRRGQGARALQPRVAGTVEPKEAPARTAKVRTEPKATKASAPCRNPPRATITGGCSRACSPTAAGIVERYSRNTIPPRLHLSAPR